MPRPVRLLTATLASAGLVASLAAPAHAISPQDDLATTAASVAYGLTSVLASSGPASMASGVLATNGFPASTIGAFTLDAAVAKGRAAIVNGPVITLVRVYPGAQVCLARIDIDAAARTAVASATACMTQKAALSTAAGGAAAGAADAVARDAVARAAADTTAAGVVTPTVMFTALKAARLASGRIPKRWGVRPATTKGPAGSAAWRAGAYQLTIIERLATGDVYRCTVTLTPSPAPATAPTASTARCRA